MQHQLWKITYDPDQSSKEIYTISVKSSDSLCKFYARELLSVIRQHKENCPESFVDFCKIDIREPAQVKIDL